MKMVFQEKAVIVENTKLNESFAHVAFRAKKIARAHICGQFVFIKITDAVHPLLRRPFSVAWVDGDVMHVVYKIVGEGTRLLSEKKAGDQIDVMGPLGKGFNIVKNTKAEKKEIVLVAGGIGIASLISLMKAYQVERGEFVTLFYGARTKDEFISENFLDIPKKNIVYVTEDGSKGHKGYVTGALEAYFQNGSAADAYVYTCGPLAMLDAVVKLANGYGVHGEANLEERMGCGVGACLGCATQTATGVQYVCKDGPVFTFEALGWVDANSRK